MGYPQFGDGVLSSPGGGHRRGMSFFDDLIDLLLPETCVGCGKAPTLLCDACAALLATPPRRVPAPAGIPSAWTVAAYDGPVRTMLSAYKERGRTPLAVPLGEALARATQAALTPPTPPTRPPPSGLGEPD